MHKRRNRRIFFVHIEKTAGTAFYQYLHGQFDPNFVAPVYGGGSVQEYVSSNKDKRLFHGHAPFRLIENAGVKFDYITFLRSPINRAFSQYCSWHNPENLNDFWRERISKVELRAVLAVQQMTFEQFVMSDDIQINGHIRNLMTKRLLSGKSLLGERVINAAAVLISRFAWFGIVEEFDHSMELLGHRFPNFRNIPVRQLNVSAKYDSTLSEQAQQRLIDLNADDLRLYNYASKVFKAKYNIYRFKRAIRIGKSRPGSN